MSESAVKATRRELRRAFGPEAAEALAQHDQDIRELRLNANAQLSARIALDQKLSARLDEHAVNLLKFREELEARTLRGRIRKLVGFFA